MTIVRGRRELGDPALLPGPELLAAARGLVARYARVGGLVPLAVARAPELDAAAGGARVHLALEQLQVTGSFKARGALLALERLAASGARHVVAASAGNHGLGVGHAARLLGLAAEVFVPEGVAAVKRAKLEATGARVVVRGAGYDACEAEALEAARRGGLPFVSPYDDPAVAAGNGGSLGAEILAALPGVEAVVAPLGGGGLAAGLGAALRASSGAVRLFGAQSEASPAIARSFGEGRAVTTLAPAPTWAEGLEGGVSAEAFARVAAVLDAVAVVDEAALRDAMRRALGLGLAVEGSSAVALAALDPLAAAGLLPQGDVVVVLTGRNVDPERLAAAAGRRADVEAC